MSSARPTTDSPLSRPFVAIAILALAALLAYANSFHVPLLLDDWVSIQENPALRQTPSLRAILSPPEGTGFGGRPVANLSFVLNYAISGDSLFGFHALNLLIHFGAALALYGVMHRTLRRLPSFAGPAASAGEMALGCALLWLVHPFATESVTYISQRTESLMGLWYLATLYSFIRSVDSPTAIGWRIATVVCCACGMATKEGMVTAPLMVLLYDRTFIATSFRETWRERRGLHLALAATWTLLPFLMSGLGTRGVGFGHGTNSWDYALIESGAIVRYLWLSVWPAPLVFDYGFDLTPALPYGFFTLGLVLVLGVAAVVGSVRRTTWGFLAAWFLVLLAPTSSIVPIPLAPISENRAYLASAAVVVALVLLVVRRETRRRKWWLAAAAVGFIALTSARNADYRTEVTIWTDTAAKRPTSARAHNNLGSALQHAGRLADARREFEVALELQPKYADAASNLAAVLGMLGRHEAATQQARRAIALDPRLAQAHFNLGIGLSHLRQLPEAAQALVETIRLRPGFAEAHAALASVLLQLNRPGDALREAQAAVAIKPTGTEGGYMAAAALVYLGRLPEAIEMFTNVVRTEPNNVEASYALGTTLLQAGRHSEAIQQLQATLRLKADHAGAHSNLGLALWQIGRLPEAVTEFETALRIDPSFAAARENLSRLRAQMP